MSFLSTIKFSEFTAALEKATNSPNTTSRQKIYTQFFNQLKKYQNNYKHKHPNEESSLYPLLRLFFANDEHERKYNMQEFRLRKLFIKILQVPHGSQHFHKIEKCNDDELAETIYEVANNRSGSKQGTLSIADVDEALSLMGEDPTGKMSLLYQKSSAIDLKWLIKIILKNMKLKIPEKKILDNYHPLANGLFERYNHLSKVCEFVESNRAEEALKEIKPFLPIRSMLSQKMTSESNKHFLDKNTFYAETKMDGERFQLHKLDGEFKYYSRNAYDYSTGFNNLITPHIKFKSVVHSVILDGEMLVWNKKEKRISTKGETDVDVKRLRFHSENFGPCFYPFDVLLLNGTSYIDAPYTVRSKILENLIQDEEGIIKRVETVKVRDNEHIASLLNIAMSNNEEGIILKNANSTYCPGERNGGWFKVKPDYLDDNVVKDFDVLIIGGCFQNEFSRDFIQKFILGAIEKKTDGTFNVYAIGEAVHGITVAKRLELSKVLCEIGQIYNGDDETAFEKGKVLFGKNKPHIFIPPHKSRILEIRASELAPTSDFFTSYTFRFPRIQSIRTDKIWDEVCTIEEFRDLFDVADGKVVKINQRKVHKDDVSSPPKKKFKGRSTFNDALHKFCQDPQLEVTPIDKALEGLEFCVMGSRDDLPSENELKILLKLHSASLTAFPRKNKTFLIVAGVFNSRNVKNYTNRPKSEDNHSVIKADWVVDHLETDKILTTLPNMMPRDFFFMTERIKKRFKGKYDQFGDSYREPIESVSELMEIVDSMPSNKCPNFSLDELKLFDAQIFDEKLPNTNIFRGLFGFFIHSESDNRSKIAENIFKYRAGTIANEDYKNAIIFVDKAHFEKNQWTHLKDREIINCRWISDSNKAKKKLNLNEYKIYA